MKSKPYIAELHDIGKLADREALQGAGLQLQRSHTYHRIDAARKHKGFSPGRNRCVNSVKFAKQTAQGLRTATVPRHREIAVGTLRSILRQAGLSIEEFIRL